MKISVLTPSFNSGKYIERSIKSVIGQTYGNWEHIIVDGNSSDNTISILKKYEHLQWISEPDSGQSEAMNKAFNMSEGDMIVYLNADDFFYDDALEKMINILKRNREYDIVVGNLHVLKDGDKFSSLNATINWKDLAILKGRFPMNPVSYMYKRKVQEKIGGFPINEHYTMDYWFLLRAFYYFKTIKVDDFFGCFAFVENNKSSVVSGEYQVQMPHALQFCLKHTPHRILFVGFKLLFHPKNPNKVMVKFNSFNKKVTKRILRLKKNLIDGFKLIKNN